MDTHCGHHWIIEPPKRSTSKGVCRLCGEEREFHNSPEASWVEQANRRDCVARIREREHLTYEEAERAVIERDKARAYYFKRFFGADDPDNPEFYHLVINTSDVPVDCAVDLVVQSAKALEEGRLRTADSVG